MAAIKSTFNNTLAGLKGMQWIKTISVFPFLKKIVERIKLFHDIQIFFLKMHYYILKKQQHNIY